MLYVDFQRVLLQMIGKRFSWYMALIDPIVTRWTKQAFSCSKFLSPGGQLWANTAFEGSQFYSIGVPKFYSWVNVISVYVHNDLG